MESLIPIESSRSFVVNLHACGNSVAMSILACNPSFGQDVRQEIKVKIFLGHWKQTLNANDPEMSIPLSTYMRESPGSIIPISLALWSLYGSGEEIQASLKTVFEAAKLWVRPTPTGNLDQLYTLMRKLLSPLGHFSGWDEHEQTLEVRTFRSQHRPLIEAALKTTPDWIALETVQQQFREQKQQLEQMEGNINAALNAEEDYYARLDGSIRLDP